MQKIILKNITSLALFSILSFIAIWFIPQIDKALLPNSVAPGVITILGVGLSITIFMVVALYFVIKNSLNIPGQFLLFAVLYNILVVVVKFSLAPYSLYLANQYLAFRNDAIFSPFRESGSAEPIFLITMTALVFLLYFVVFWFIYFLFERKVNRELFATNFEATLASKHKKILKRIGSMLLVGILILASSGIFFILLWSFSTVEYLIHIFSTWVSLFMALALVGAVYFVTGAFKSAKEQALILRNVAVLVSFFWIGAAFLLIYHALWVVYIIVLTSLWPLRVVVPK